MSRWLGILLALAACGGGGSKSTTATNPESGSGKADDGAGPFDPQGCTGTALTQADVASLGKNTVLLGSPTLYVRSRNAGDPDWADGDPASNWPGVTSSISEQGPLAIDLENRGGEMSIALRSGGSCQDTTTNPWTTIYDGAWCDPPGADVHCGTFEISSRSCNQYPVHIPVDIRYLSNLSGMVTADCARFAKEDSYELNGQTIEYQAVLLATPPAPLRCPDGWSPCDGVCVQLDSDSNNCGACGNACAAGQACAWSDNELRFDCTW